MGKELRPLVINGLLFERVESTLVSTSLGPCIQLFGDNGSEETVSVQTLEEIPGIPYLGSIWKYLVVRNT